MRTFLFLLALPLLAETWTFQGVPVSYSVRGTGPAVVQIHGIGAGASAEQTKYQVQALVQAGYKVYSIDLAGWGESIGPAQLFTGPFYGALVTAFVDEVTTGNVALIGHSLGGTYAIAAAAALPDRVSALILNAPVGALTFTQESNASSAARWQDFVSTPGGQAAYNLLGSWPSLRLFCEQTLYVDPSFCTARTIQDYSQYTRQPDSIYGAAAFLTGNLGLNVRTRFAGLTMPILLIWGEQNVFTSLQEAAEFQVLNGSARLVVIPQSGALVNDEEKDSFNALVLQELTALRR